MPRHARLRASVAVAAAAACLLRVAVATAAGPTPEQALAELNAWRALAHESPVGALDPNRSEGCRLHNAYEALNGHVLTHDEMPGNPGYSSLGATAGASSVLSAGEVGPREAWENAPYHRMSLLNPRMSVTGFDASSGSTCMNVFAEEVLDGGPATAELALYPWPADGARGVPLAFSGGEVPSPYQAVPAGTKLGFALTVNVNGPWVQRAGTEVAAVSLTSDAGVAVPIAPQDRNSVNGPNLGGGFALFPLVALAQGTWYTAHAAGVVYGAPESGSPQTSYPFDVSWRFQTRLPPPDTLIAFDGVGGIRVSTNSSAPVHVTVLHAGMPVATRDLRNGLWATRLPPGQYGVCTHQDISDSYAEVPLSCQTMTVVTRPRVRLRTRLRAGTLRVAITVAPPHASVTLTLSSPAACSGHGAGSCTHWRVFRVLTRPVRSKLTIRIRVGRADRVVRVRAVAGAGPGRAVLGPAATTVARP